MPNWCEGNIRLRGKRSAIVEFLKSELEYIGRPKLTAEPESGPVEVKESYGEVRVMIPEDKRALPFARVRIKGTRRNFIDGACIEVYVGDEEDDDAEHTVCIDGVRAAWAFDADPYIEKSKKHSLDIRIVGFECGMQFMQDIEIIDGELRKNNEICYADWAWECTMPNMGG